MPNDDNACIRYLMKEMDPSEEVLMERAMMEDDDLLIEVECLRQTFKRLDDMPDREPPPHLTESIIEQAVEYREQKNTALHYLPFADSFKYVAAASVALLLSVAGIWMYEDRISSNFDNNNNNGNGNTASSAVQEAFQTPIISNSFQITPVNSKRIEPWVDRNNIIRFQDRFNQANAEFDSILKNSMQKLTPVTDPSVNGGNSRTLQMTGTGTNQ